MDGRPDGADDRPAPAARSLVSDRQRTAPVRADRGAGALAARRLAAEGINDGELTLSFVDPPEIEDLHVRFMDEPGPTDVLSFPLGEDGLLGDVIVCPAVAAGEQPGRPGGELRLLVVHGVLHVLGYDHHDDGERAEMWARQERYSGVRVP